VRFVFAIVAFVVAVVLVGLGIAQRTVFHELAKNNLTVELDQTKPFVVVGPDALTAHPGTQTVSVSGSADIYVAYGRTTDMNAWLGDVPRTLVSYHKDKDRLITAGAAGAHVTKSPSPAPQRENGSATDAPSTAAPTASVAPTTTSAPGTSAANVPSPVGSDLWLNELTGQQLVTITLSLTSGISLLISGNGGSVMPSKLTLSWPVDSKTPLAGPFILGGIIMFVAGLVLLLVGFLHFRRSRGPRRGRPRGLRGLLHVPPRPAKDVTSTSDAHSGRRRRVAVSLSALLLLSGCSPDYWPSPVSTEPAIETPNATAPVAGPAPSAAPKPGDLQVEPAVTVSQMERIMQRVSEFAATVDSSRDAKAAEQRFTGPALESRVANYTIRGTLTSQPAPPPIPASPLTLTLPQQVTDWPRTVLTIAKDSAAPTVAPMALVLVQDSPRTNYRVEYTMSLAPDAQVPEVAPASIGAAPISPEFKGLVLPTGQVGAAYADILTSGDKSKWYNNFHTSGDQLVQQLGVEGQNTVRSGLPKTASIEFATRVAVTPILALATNNAGALVALALQQEETVTPNDGGTTGFQTGAVAAALSGFTGKSSKGVQRVTGIQLLFYVPSVSTTSEKVRLLGWSESLIGASELK